jgi:DedD protein
MAFFSLRKGGDAAATTSPGLQPESIEAMRRRAKHRLIGAFVLVLIGVVGFPLLFDTQPRPVSVDIPIEIPDRGKAKPLNVPAPPVTQSTPSTQQPSAAGSVTQAPAARQAAPAPALAPATTASVAKAEPAPASPAPAPAPKAEVKPEPKQEAKAGDDGSKAQALLEGKPVASTPMVGEGRYVVQVGAFSDVTKARETRVKLERAGMKTYTQVVETKDGKRIRVRLGPYATKADADKAAEKVKGLDLQPAVLTL